MSKDTPEVGDVWKANSSGIVFYLSSIDVRDKKMMFSMAQDGRTKRILVDNYFLMENTYLGKSKANIDDLFKTENEE